MSAKRERTTPLNSAGAQTSAPVGLLLANPPRKGGGGARARAKAPGRDAGRVEREKRRRVERVDRRVDMQYIVSHLLAAGDDHDTESTLIRVCAALRDLMGWDEVTFWPAHGHAGMLGSARSSGISAQAVAVSTADARHAPVPPVPLISRLAAVGHVFATGKPAYLMDGASGSSGTPNESAPVATSGGRSAFVFPIRGTTDLLGVMECQSVAPRLPDTTRLREAATVGTVIGRFIERQREHTRAASAPARTGPSAIEEAVPAQSASAARQLDAAFDALADSVLIFDREGHILHANAADRAMLGYESPATSFTRSVHERGQLLLAREQRGQPITMEQSPFERILRGETLSGQQAAEATLRTPAGREIRVSTTGAPLVDGMGNLIGGVAITRDVTEQRRRERSLRDANRRMQEFLAIAAHDLRTPITAGKGYVQLAVRRLNKLEAAATTDAPALVGSIEQLRKNLEDAEQSAQRLARLADRLLDVAHIQAHKLEMRTEAVDLAAIIYAKVREQRLATPARAIRYKVRPIRAIPTLIDPDRIGQVLLNYLANALKYSPEDSVVEVTLDVRDKAARVSVRDAGAGIPAAERERIWLRFEQLDGTQQHSSGTGLGLGLYISRAIIEAHGGHVGVESTVGQGSTFWFDVPLMPPSD